MQHLNKGQVALICWRKDGREEERYSHKGSLPYISVNTVRKAENDSQPCGVHRSTTSALQPLLCRLPWCAIGKLTDHGS